MTQLVSKDENAVVAYETPDGGWQDGNDDLAPAFPMVTIMQPMSQVKGNTPGFFFHSDTGEVTSNLFCVPLTRTRTRAIFTMGDEKPLCRSFDAVVPAPRQRLWQAPLLGGERITLANAPHRVPPVAPANCASCIFSDWGGPNGDEAPPCKEADLIVIARNADIGDLAMLRINGTSLKPYRDWIKNRVLPKRLPSYAFSLDLETVEMNKPGKKWWQLVVRSNELTLAEQWSYYTVVKEFRTRIETAVKEAGGEVEEWVDDQPFE